MAINRPPKNTLELIFGPLGVAADRVALSPVLIAPRYELYRFGGKDDNALSIGMYNTGTALTAPYPVNGNGVQIVDVNSVDVFAKAPYLTLNDVAISPTKAKATNGGVGTWLSFNKPVINGDIAELRGNNVSIGDLVTIEGVTGTTARVIMIGDRVEAVASDVKPVAVTGTAVDWSLGIVLDGQSEDVQEMSIEFLTAVTPFQIKLTVLQGADAGATETVSLAGTTDTSVPLTLIPNGTITWENGATGIAVGDSYVASYKNTLIKNSDVLIDYAPATPLTIANKFKFHSNKVVEGYVGLKSGVDTDEDGIEVGILALANTMGMDYTVFKAELFARFRALRTDDALELVDSTGTGVAEWVGPADPDNPLGFMYATATYAAANVEGSLGSRVYLMAVENNSDEAYVRAVNYAGKFEDAYGIVTYSQTTAVRAEVSRVIAKYSNKEVSQFKKGWFVSNLVPGQFLEGSFVGAVSGGILEVAGDVDLTNAGLKSGDKVFGQGPYDSTTGKRVTRTYKIVEIVGTKHATVAGDTDYTSPMSLLFSRELNTMEHARAIADEASSINNYRINYLWADTVNALGYTGVSRVYAAAALAAMRGALPPHAPLSDVVIPGIQVVDTLRFGDPEYNILNDSGVWVAKRDTRGRTITMHQITTRTDGTISEEDSIVSNADNIARTLRGANEQYRGNVNVTPALVDQIRANIMAARDSILGRSYPVLYGPQILDMEIKTLRIDPNNDARIICEHVITVPKPNLGLDQVISVI